MAISRSSSRVLKDYRSKANSAGIEKEEVPRPKSGGTGDVFTRESAPVPWRYGGGGGSLVQIASSWAREIGRRHPGVKPPAGPKVKADRRA